MKILIVSDTHGEDENLDRVLLRETPFDMLIHCGDVEGREEYLEMAADCPVYMVAGNCDYYSDLPSEVTITIGKHRVFVTHGHGYSVSWDLDKLISAAISRNCDTVLFGHIHRPMVENIDEVFCVNPGSLVYPRQNDRRPTYAVMELLDDGRLHAEIRYLDEGKN